MHTSSNISSGSVVYLSHGGGPLPLLGDESHQEMIALLEQLPSHLEQPSAMIVISAHWEADKPTITNGLNPGLLYDYYGFPEEAYEITYPVSGKPPLAQNIFDLLNEHGIEAVLNDQRAFDHGVFVPLKIMYPEAMIPCVQVSLVRGLRPDEHIRLGKALAGLRKESVLVIGCGFSFHNLNAFFAPSTPETQAMNEAFEQWLIDTCSNQQLSEREREDRLIHWENAPAARYCHPREEHLLPLHVCYGIAGTAAKEVFTFEIMGKKASAYVW
jgi:aromatic ring-opening dioxygenase catalytic subunit (LigB family)